MTDTKTQISTLWIVVMLNMIFADIYSIIIEISGGHLLEIPGNVETMMLIAVFLTNIPIMMIYFSRVLSVKINRRLNIGAAIFTILYIIGGSAAVPHYIAAALIEVAVLAFIIRIAWKWEGETVPSP